MKALRLTNSQFLFFKKNTVKMVIENEKPNMSDHFFFKIQEEN